MAEFPMFPLWTDALLADTVELNDAEFGSYLALLIAMWRNGGSLPNDASRLARFARCSPRSWPGRWEVLKGYFRVENDEIVQGRLLDELDRARRRSRKGETGARAKWRKNNEAGASQASKQPSKSDASRPQPQPQPQEEDNNSPDPVAEAVAIWNDFAGRYGLSKAQKVTGARAARIRARLADVAGLEGWRLAVEMVADSDFLLGRTKTDFKAGLDFLLQESSFVKLLEGNYRTNKRAASPAMEALRKLREDA